MEKMLINGNVIPVKMRRCNKYRGKILCATCNNQINENKKFEAIIKLLKREAPNEFDYMLPFFIEQDNLYVIVVQF